MACEPACRRKLDVRSQNQSAIKPVSAPDEVDGIVAPRLYVCACVRMCVTVSPIDWNFPARTNLLVHGTAVAPVLLEDDIDGEDDDELFPLSTLVGSLSRCHEEK